MATGVQPQQTPAGYANARHEFERIMHDFHLGKLTTAGFAAQISNWATQYEAYVCTSLGQSVKRCGTDPFRAMLKQMHPIFHIDPAQPAPIWDDFDKPAQAADTSTDICHIFHAGATLCGMQGPPHLWPPRHTRVAPGDSGATCATCIARSLNAP